MAETKAWVNKNFLWLFQHCLLRCAEATWFLWDHAKAESIIVAQNAEYSC